MIRLFNNFYLLDNGFRAKRLMFTFSNRIHSKYEDYTEHTYIKLFWRVYKLVRSTTYFDQNRPPLSFVHKYRVV